MAKPTTPVAESLTATSAPVAAAEKAAMDMGANVKCVLVPEEKPAKTECGYDIIVQPPVGKGVLAYLVGPGANVVLKGVDADAATFTKEGENLRITTAEGGEILLLDFVTAAKEESCTSITTDAGKMGAGKLLAGLGAHEKVADVEPAAGPERAPVRPAAPAVVQGRGGFTAPTIDGDGFGIGDNVLSTIIAPFAIPFGRDSIDYKDYPTSEADIVGKPPVVVPPNAPPVANDDTATVSCGVVCGHSVTINALANDTDSDGNPLTITGISGLNPAQGTASIVGNQIVFTPAAGVTGAVVFSYSVSDGHGGTDTATVTVNVTNTPPDAVNDTTTTAFNTNVTVNVLANDTDAECKPGVRVTGASINPAQGSVVVNADGTITFNPADTFTGVATITYSIADGCGGTDTATLTVTVGTPPNHNPDAVNDVATVSCGVVCGHSVTINALANDTDSDGNPLTITGISGLNPAQGTA
ncbi:MAG: Ig-like domain-containing protein, partial [Alphaproteobacteria bacterium]